MAICASTKPADYLSVWLTSFAPRQKEPASETLIAIG